jgi:class 3 adenylate cyclase
VRGALDIRDAVGRKRRSDPSFDARLRTAIHAGEPLIEHDDLLGHDVNITARLLDHCEPGEIVISEAARQLAGRRLRKVSFSDKRWVKIRGLTTKVAILSVDRNGGDPGRPASG